MHRATNMDSSNDIDKQKCGENETDTPAKYSPGSATIHNKALDSKDRLVASATPYRHVENTDNKSRSMDVTGWRAHYR